MEHKPVALLSSLTSKLKVIRGQKINVDNRQMKSAHVRDCVNGFGVFQLFIKIKK